MTTMSRRSIRTALLMLVLMGVAVPSFAQITAVPFVSGLSSPVGLVQDPSDPATQYVVEQPGLIKVIRNGVVLTEPFIDLTAEARFGGESGLLGLAFPTDYARSGRFYVYYNSDPSGAIPTGAVVVSRYRRSAANPYEADKATRFDLRWPAMTDMHSTCVSVQAVEQGFICDPYSNHNGGKIAFGPDGYLYLAMGDGGGAGDPENQAQRPFTLLGKIVRIDVSVDDSDPRGYRIPPDNPFVDGVPIAALPEIWSFGVRNPWRLTFDDPTLGGTGAMTFGDVGQGSYEEIDYEPARAGGRNYAWRTREGAHPYSTSTGLAYPIPTEPIHEYGDSVGVNNSTSITGGYVYRGTSLGAFYQGRYFYADYISGRVFSIALTIDGNGEATASDEREHTSAVNPDHDNISSIDVDFRGELYLVKYAPSGTSDIVRLTVLGDGDLDDDGLPDDVELRYGLDPLSSTGANGAAGDPDGDLLPNSLELTQGTHPRGTPALTRYLAEGASSPFFETALALANPNPEPAIVLLRFLREGNTVVTRQVTVPGKRRLTINPGQLGLLTFSSFSTIAETDREVVLERTMLWDASGYGAHTEKAVTGPASTWYFAEGAQGYFYTYLLLQNPSSAPNNVQIRWLIENGSPVTQNVTVQPTARLTVDAGAVLALNNRAFGIEVTFQDAPGIAERAMYFGPNFMGGHESAGVTAPALDWYLAEGATGPFFQTYILCSNPSNTPADVTITYFTGTGQTVTRTKTVPANGRLTTDLESEGASELTSAAVATRVQSASVPIVVERAQYWGPTWYEAHNSFGVTQASTHWGLSEGKVGGVNEAQTYILLANPGSSTASVTIEFIREAGAPITKTFNVSGSTRFNVTVGPNTLVPELGHERFSANLTSTAPIVVERALYLNANGLVWSAGTSATATRLP